MKLDNLKQLLLRKSVGNKNLFSWIEYMGEDVLISHVVEALQKMPFSTESKGSKANRVLRAFAGKMDETDVHQIRDALSHHVSHYKSALKALHATPDAPEHTIKRMKLRKVADQHLGHLLPLMDFAERVGANSDPSGSGKRKLRVDYPKLPAWEANYTTLRRHPDTGRFELDPKLLSARAKPGAKKWTPERPEKHGIPDYHYLEMPPHPGHPHVSKYPHTSGYPWEEVRVGSQDEHDKGEGYLHLEDIPDKAEYTPHPFDNHPAYKQVDTKEDDITEPRAAEFAQALDNWRDSDHFNNWMNMQEQAESRDPEAFERRGKVKAPPFWDDTVKTQDHLGHVHEHPRMKTYAELQAEKDGTAPTASATGPTIRRATSPDSPPAVSPTRAAGGGANPAMEEAYQAYTRGGPAIKAIFEKHPEFMAYLKSRKG